MVSTFNLNILSEKFGKFCSKYMLSIIALLVLANLNLSGQASWSDGDLDDDGIIDSNDADIDNDGIPNDIENNCGSPFDLDWLDHRGTQINGVTWEIADPIVEDGITVDVTLDDPFGIGLSDFGTIKAQNIGGFTPVLYFNQDANNINEYTDIWISFSEPMINVSFSMMDIDLNSWTDSLAIIAYFQGNPYDLTPDEVTITNPASVSFNDAANAIIGVMDNNPQSSTNGNALISLANPVDSICIRYGNAPNAPANPAAQIIGFSLVTGTTLCDTDNDGLPDIYDLDSDDDGCIDAVESGSGYTIQADSTVVGPYGTNGLADTLEDPDDSGIIDYTLGNNGSLNDFQNAAVNGCTPEVCGNGFDDDNDGMTDCDDPDCQPTIDSVNSADPTCPTAANGQIFITASATSGDLEYSIDGGTTFQSSGTYTNLAPGDYDLVVQIEGSGCSVAYSSNPVTLNDPGCGSPPDAVTDTVTVNEDEGPFILNPQDNDSDPDGDDLTTNIISGPTSGGTAVVLDGDSILYNPPLNYCGPDTIIYEVCDLANCDSDTIFINVICIQDPPDQGNEAVVTDEDVPLNGIDLDDNNPDPDGDPVTVTVPGMTSEGGIVIDNGDGTIDYIPPPDYNGSDTLIYEVCDDQLPPNCVTDTLFITVNPINDPPGVISGNGIPTTNDTILINTILDTPINICVDGIDPDNDPYDITASINDPSNGTNSGFADGDSCFTYTPDMGWLGLDTTTVIICDPGPLCDTLTVIINTTPDNDPPDAVTDTISVFEDMGPIVIDAQDNDSDPENDPLTTTIISGPTSGGTAIVLGGDSISYDPPLNYCGPDTIIYQICDAFNCDTDTIFINVICVQDPPDQGNETVVTDEDVPLGGIDLNDNNPDPDGDPVTVIVGGTTTQGGTVIDNGDGTIDYIPPPDYNGPDTLIYQVCDDQIPPNCVTDTLFITVLPVNDPPDITGGNGNNAVNDTITVITILDTPITICMEGTDVDGDPFDVTNEIDPPNDGMNSGFADADSCFTYSPDVGYLGNDTTTVIICDPGLECDTITVIILVLPNQDTDDDGIPDAVDVDDDNDGIPDTVEIATAGAGGDTDGDGLPDHLDLDSDNDGIPDIVEAGGTDTDGDGIVDDQLDADADGIPDSVDVDFTLGTDLDMDGIDDTAQGGPDADGDGIQDSDDPDADGDGMDDDDNTPNPPDTDGDGQTDFQDLDSDNDGLFDITEANDGDDSLDQNGDGMVGIGVIFDNDFDGFADLVDTDNNNTPAPNDGFGNPLPTPDTDEDGHSDHLDLDTDNDGIPDMIEWDFDGDGLVDDWDGDGVFDYQDLDSDNDGIADVIEAGGNDLDGDGLIGSGIEADLDGDGLADLIDNDPDDGPDANNENNVDSTSVLWDNDGNGTNEDENDTDGDGQPDYLDLDSDNDGLQDILEAGGTDADGDGLVDDFVDNDGDGWDDDENINFPEDTDGDGTPDHQDLDSDNDGISDIVELNNGDASVDMDGDGMIDDFEDTDGDGWDDSNESDPVENPDTDGDGITDHEDLDSDNDGILDSWENDPNSDGLGPDDFDGDGIPDYQDLDSDNDTMPDIVEAGGTDADGNGVIDDYNDGNDDGADDDDIITDPADTDMDGAPDHNDIDSDNDGITDIIEAHSGDNTLDTDGDGMIDVFVDDNGDGWDDVNGVSNPPDFDGNGDPDYTDLDSDEDGLPDEIENDVDGDGQGPDDSDGDGWPNYLDVDSDDDGISDGDEYDPDGDGTPNDCDEDGLPDWLDPDDCDVSLIIPQGFSPNGDLIDDTWVIENLDDYPNNRIFIFNRWGTPIQEYQPYNNDWDGTYKGEPLPTGTYYYLIYLNIDSDPIGGWVYIINE